MVFHSSRYSTVPRGIDRPPPEVFYVSMLTNIEIAVTAEQKIIGLKSSVVAAVFSPVCLELSSQLSTECILSMHDSTFLESAPSNYSSYCSK